jgi:hypothetical protein
MILVALLLTTTAPAPRSFGEERELLDRRLAAVRRKLPDGAQPAGDIAHVNALADAALLRRASVNARPPAETRGLGELTIDVSAFGRFTSIETFFRQVMQSPRLIDVESLALASTPEDTIKLTAVLKLPYWPSNARLPPAPEGIGDRARGVSRGVADAFVRDHALLLAKTEATVTLRRTRRSPRLFLSEIADALQDRPIVLTELSWGDELFVARGYSMGEGPTRDLERRLESGYFRVAEFLMARFGGCRRFEVRGRSPMAGAAIEMPLAQDDPFRQDDAPCRVDRDPAGGDVIRAAGAKVKTTPGPLTIHAHDIDRADLFLVLHDLTGQAFLVDESVRGRVSAELVGVTLDEAIAAFQKAGLYVGPGPVRRVSMSPIPAATPDNGPPLPQDVRVSLALKRTGVREVLSILAQAEPTLAASAPEGALGYVSIWARDVDLRTLRARLFDSAGLSESVAEDGTRTVFRGNGGSDTAASPILPTSSPRRLLMHASDLSPDDFDLSAVAGVEGAWRAFAYSPAGTLHRYAAGDRLTDGTVRSVEPTAVVIDTDDGPVWVHLTLP